VTCGKQVDCILDNTTCHSATEAVRQSGFGIIMRKVRFTAGAARGVMPPEISSISCRFVLWEAVSQTKCYWSLKLKIFAPPELLDLLRYCASPYLGAPCTTPRRLIFVLFQSFAEATTAANFAANMQPTFFLAQPYMLTFYCSYLDLLTYSTTHWGYKQPRHFCCFVTIAARARFK